MADYEKLAAGYIETVVDTIRADEEFISTVVLMVKEGDYTQIVDGFANVRERFGVSPEAMDEAIQKALETVSAAEE